MYEYIHMCENDRVQTIHHYCDIVRNTTIRCVNGNIYSAYYQLWYVYRCESVKRALHLNSYIREAGDSDEISVMRIITLGYYNTFKHVWKPTQVKSGMNKRLYVGACQSGQLAMVYHILRNVIIKITTYVEYNTILCSNKYVRRYLLFLLCMDENVRMYTIAVYNRPDAVNKKWDKILEQACIVGNMYLVKQLCDVNVRTRITRISIGEYKPSEIIMHKGLMNACRNGHRRIVKYLINMGVNLSLKRTDFDRPISAAIRYGRDLKLIKTLVHNGENTRKIMSVRPENSQDVVRYVLKKGLQSSAINSSIEFACRSGNLECLKTLLPYADKDNYHETRSYFVLATLSGSLDIIKCLVVNGFLANKHSILILKDTWYNAKHVARGNCKEIMRYCDSLNVINQSPCYIHRKSNIGYCKSQCYEIFNMGAHNILRTFYSIYYLRRVPSIKRWCHIRQKLSERNGNYMNIRIQPRYLEIFKYAVKNGMSYFTIEMDVQHISILDWLYKYTIKSESADKVREFMNKQLIYSSDLRMIKYIMHHGGDINYVSQYNSTAISNKHGVRVIKYILGAGVTNIGQLFVNLCYSNRVKSMRYLFKNGYGTQCPSDILVKLYDSLRINGEATEQRDLLIHNGAQINIDFGEPLFAAIKRGFIQQVRFLVQHGARVLPRHIAFAEHLQYPEIVDCLLSVKYTNVLV